MWQPILAGNPELDKKIHEIAKALKENIAQETHAGLLTGLPGIAVFFANYDAYTGTRDNEEFIGRLVSDSFEAVQTKWHPVSFCSGLPGMLWAVDHLSELGIPDMDTDTDETDDFLTREMLAGAEKNDFDFLHGAGGLLYYFLSRKRQPDPEALGKVLSFLSKYAVRDETGAIAWESLVDIENPKVVKNISLSHGMSSTIIILSIFYEQFRTEESRTLLEGALKFLRASRNQSPDTRSLFPGYVQKEQVDDDSRLGWCYGDMGIGLALRRAGKALDDPALQEEGIAILRHSARRRDPAKDYVRDAGLCHGSAGIAHIFNRVFQETGDPLFKEAAIYWIDQALAMAVGDESTPAGYQAYNGITGWQNELQLLEGVAGIGLSFIAAASDIPATWDRSLLIS